MSASQKPGSRISKEAGLGLMEAIVAILVTLIVGSILLQLVRMGIATFKLNSATNSIAQSLEQARGLAMSRSDSVKVIFDAKGSRFGVDKNNNGRLDSIEVEELPSDIGLAGDAVVIFSKSGKLARESEQPSISISNNRSSRTVSVSSVGAIQIE